MKMTRRKFIVAGTASGVAAYVAISRRRRTSEVEAGTGGKPMRTVLYAIEGNDKAVSDAAADDLARKWDIIICQKYQFGNQVTRMLSLNATLVMASYFNATHSQDDGHPEAWYVHDAQGRRIQSKAFPSNNLMNPRSAWVEFVINALPSLVASGYNAVYMDEMGVGPIRTDGTTSQAVLPGTNDPWTEALWEPDMNTMLGTIATATEELVYANGLGNGIRYFAPDGAATEGLLLSADRVLGESFLRGSKMPTEPTTLFKATDTSWKRDIQMVIDAGPRGMFCCKIWSYPNDPATQDQVERWATGSFLLGCYPKSGWFFSSEKAATLPEWRPMYDTMKKIGVPLNAATFTGSTGHRDFMNGYVDVDNAHTDAKIVVTT